jgi:hypothetical protein
MPEAKYTSYPGINYSGDMTTNRDTETGIRYGVIRQNQVDHGVFFESAEPAYPEPEVECPCCGATRVPRELDADMCCPCGWDLTEALERAGEYLESVGMTLTTPEYQAHSDEVGDIFITRSPYFTFAQFCSPCCPGACHLENPLDEEFMDNRCYCFGHEFFEDNMAPYKVFSVLTGLEVKPESTPGKES